MTTLHVDEMAISKAVVFDWGMEGNGEKLSQGGCGFVGYISELTEISQAENNTCHCIPSTASEEIWLNMYFQPTIYVPLSDADARCRWYLRSFVTFSRS